MTADTALRPRRRPTLARRVGRWVLGLATVALVAVLLATVVVPLVMGWIPLTVLTGSMRPSIPPGSQVIVKPLDAPQATGLQAGQVITFMPEPGSDEVVTHRIVEAQPAEDGGVQYVTKGDNNDAPDPEPVRSEQVRGLVRYSVPLAGYAAQLLSPDQKRTGAVVLAGALGAYAIGAFVWDNVRRRRTNARH